MFNNKFTKKDPVAEEIEKIISETWDDDEWDAKIARLAKKAKEGERETYYNPETGRYGTRPKKAANPEKKLKEVASEFEKNISERWHDDDEDDDVAKADRELARMKAKPIKADTKTNPDKEMSKLSKRTPKEVDEELKGSQHKLDVAKPKGKLTGADFKKLRNEDSEQIDEISRDLATRYLNKAKGSMPLSDLSGKRKAGATLALKKKWGDKNFGIDEPKVKATEEFEHVKEAKGPTSTYGLDTFAKEANEPVTPLSRAKELARTAMSRIKNEMLGKAGATSEEIDPTIKSTDTLKGRIKGGKDDDVGPSATGRSTKVKYTPGPK